MSVRWRTPPGGRWGWGRRRIATSVRGLRLIAAVATLAIVSVACSGSSTSQAGPSGASTPAGTGLKIAFVYDGAMDDGSWNSSHAAAMAYVQKQLPGASITNLASIAPGDQARATFQGLGTQGVQLVIATTYYQPDVLAVAKDFPNTKFISWAGYKTTPNVGGYSLATEDGRYLDGIIAGSVTKSNIVGYPAGYPIGEVVRGIDAFTLGALTVNPSIKVIPLWINSWYDPTKEREAAQALVNQGADILATETNSPAVGSVAARANAGFIGYGWNQSSFAPKQWLSSFIFNWGPYYLAQAKAVQDGTWKPAIYYGGLAQGDITMSPFGPAVPKSTVALVQQKMAQLASGKIHIFDGPIYNNTGKLQLKPGQMITGAQPLTNCCDWLVKGVEGTVPKG